MRQCTNNKKKAQKKDFFTISKGKYMHSALVYQLGLSVIPINKDSLTLLNLSLNSTFYDLWFHL